MSLIIYSKTLAAANASIIAASQTPGAAGALTLVGGGTVALDTQRRVLITSAANLSNVTFAITGTRDTGQIVTETLTGPNASTAQSLNDYRTITSIVISGLAAGALTVGTSSVGSYDWKLTNTRADTFSLSINCTVTGTVTYSIETTNSRFLGGALNPVSPTNPIANPVATTIASATSSASISFAVLIHAWRLTILSGTGSVTVEAQTNSY